VNVLGDDIQNKGGDGAWTVVNDDAQARELLAYLTDPSPQGGGISGTFGPFGIDTETEGVDPRSESPCGRGRIVCWSIAWPDFRLGTHPRGFNLARRAFLWADQLHVFKDWLEDHRVPKVGHNIFSFDRHVFLNAGINLRGIVGDTLRMSRFLNADKGAEHGLKSLMERVLGYRPVGEYRQLFSRHRAAPVTDQGEVTETWRKVAGYRVPTVIGGPVQRVYESQELIPLSEIPRDYPWLLPTLYDYASLDAKATLELFLFFRTLLQKRPAKRLGGGDHGTMWDLYERWWNCNLLQATEYERAGVDIDDAICQSAVAKIDADMGPLEGVIAAWAPGVNWRSSKQYTEFLYERKRFRVPPYCGSKPEAAKRTPRGKRPGDFVALTWIADQTSTGPEDKAGLRAVLAFKKLQTERRFAAELPLFKAPHDGRLHTVLAPEADTGRYSARNPALQQIPKADRYKVRKAFVAPPGHSLIVADYSQLEMYVLAHFCKAVYCDDTVEQLLASGDMHGSMAIRCWPEKLKGLTPADLKHHPDPGVRFLREAAKSVGYGLNYGKTAAGLGVGIRQNGEPIGTAAAQQILDAYYAAVPSLPKLQAWFIEYAREHWGVHTLLGRFRPLVDVQSDDDWARGEGERAALNTPIQGSAHDIVATAMLRLNTSREPDLIARGWFHEELADLGAVGTLQVHDELQWRVPSQNAERAAAIVKAGMERPFTTDVLLVPLKADVCIAPSWGAAK
jgi:DNA polymerase I-like protein with 3'-5' exonuclease and polymerase domains